MLNLNQVIRYPLHDELSKMQQTFAQRSRVKLFFCGLKYECFNLLQIDFLGNGLLVVPARGLSKSHNSETTCLARLEYKSLGLVVQVFRSTN